MQINGLLEHDISAPDAAAAKSAIRDAVQRTEAVVEDLQGKPLSTEIDGHVGLDSSNQRAFETNSQGETGDLVRAQTCISATLAGLNTVLLTAEQGNPLSTEIDGHVGLDSSNQRTFKTNSKGEAGDPLVRAQTCISAPLAGLNAVLLTAEQEFGRAGPRGSDPVLMYGQPRVRDQDWPTQPKSAAPPVEWPWLTVEMPRRLTLRHLSDIPPASGAGALVEGPLRLTLEPRVDSRTAAKTKGRGFWRVMLHAGGVLGFAAFVVWVVVSIPSARRLGHETMQLGFSGAPLPPDLSRQVAVPGAVPAPSERPDQVAVTDRSAPEHKDQPDSVGSAAVPSASAPIISTPTRAAITKQPPRAMIARETPPAAQPAPQPTVQPTPQPAGQATTQPMAQDLITRQIDPNELASLVRRGDDFVNFRDLSSARLLYRRAAEAGNVRAALALAGTFDPNVLQKLGFPENVGEVTKARLWYERAQQLGSAEAPQRLEQLATVTNSGK